MIRINIVKIVLGQYTQFTCTFATENRIAIKCVWQGWGRINDTDHDRENISETLTASKSCSTTQSVEKVSVWVVVCHQVQHTLEQVHKQK